MFFTGYLFSKTSSLCRIYKRDTLEGCLEPKDSMTDCLLNHYIRLKKLSSSISLTSVIIKKLQFHAIVRLSISEFSISSHFLYFSFVFTFFFLGMTINSKITAPTFVECLTHRVIFVSVWFNFFLAPKLGVRKLLGEVLKL